MSFSQAAERCCTTFTNNFEHATVFKEPRALKTVQAWVGHPINLEPLLYAALICFVTHFVALEQVHVLQSCFVTFETQKGEICAVSCEY